MTTRLEVSELQTRMESLMPTHPLRSKVTQAIASHLNTGGSGGWAALLQRFPTVDRRTFFRWVAEVRSEPASATPSTAVAPPGGRDLCTCGGQLAASFGQPLTQWLSTLRGQAELLLSAAKNTDGSIKNPMLYEKACRLHLETMTSTMYHLDVLTTVDGVMKIVEDVLMEIHAVDVAACHRIVGRLREWHDESGIHAWNGALHHTPVD